MEEKPGAGTAGPYEFRLSYDSRDPRQVRKASLIHAIDVWNQVELVNRAPATPGPGELPRTGKAGPAASSELSGSAASSAGLELQTRDQQLLTGYPLFVKLAHALLLLWPLVPFTYIPGLIQLGRALWPGAISTEKGSSRESSAASSSCNGKK
jgi:hypothetical protein